MVRTVVVITLLLFIPFCHIFAALPQTQSLGSCLNYLALGLAVIAFPRMVSRISFRVVLLCSSGVVIYGLNYLLGPFASAKWFMNTLGFLFVFAVISNYMKTVSRLQLTLLERYFDRLMLLLWGACACACFVTLYCYWDAIVAFTTTLRFNHSIVKLTQDYGLQKQALGPFLAAVVLWHVVYWNSLGRVRKAAFLLFMVLSIPFFIGIRTLLLSLGLLWIFVLWGSRNITVPTKCGLLILVPLCVLFMAVWWEVDVASLILRKYNRLPSVLFAVETFREYPGGLGNGGYTPFVLARRDSLFSEYGIQAYGLHWFPLAPESDIAYFIASFGLLCPVFGLLYIYILSNSSYILHSCVPHRFEVFVLLFAVVLIFAGISQDFAGKLGWWTYLGAATGVIFRYCPAIHVAGGGVQILGR